MKVKASHNYSLCKKCNKKGVYLYTVRKHTSERGFATTGATVEYCKYCTPRTGVPRAVAKLGILARLRKLFAG